jgi:hypothetical protein
MFSSLTPLKDKTSINNSHISRSLMSFYVFWIRTPAGPKKDTCCQAELSRGPFFAPLCGISKCFSYPFHICCESLPAWGTTKSYLRSEWIRIKLGVQLEGENTLALPCRDLVIECKKQTDSRQINRRGTILITCMNTEVPQNMNLNSQRTEVYVASWATEGVVRSGAGVGV